MNIEFSTASKTRIVLFVIALIVIAWGGALVITAGSDYYWIVERYGKAYYGADYLSKNNTSVENAAIFAEAKREIILARMRDFTQIGAGVIMALVGIVCSYKLLPRGNREEDKSINNGGNVRCDEQC